MMSGNVAVRARWRSFSTFLAVSSLGLGAVLLALILMLDPYGIRASAHVSPRPLMDLNQRFMYPQVVRSGRFDAAVLGTSTVRLLDPMALDSLTGFRFANLAMNAATPWEQMQMAGLFMKEVPLPKAVIWGIDTTWCEADATLESKRLTPRPFPPWLYHTPDWRDWPRLASFTSLEVAARLAGYHFGINRERIRGDGFEVFTPPEQTYDAARARAHLYRGTGGLPPDTSPLDPAQALLPDDLAGLQFPALDWLESQLRKVPSGTRIVLVLSPVHVASQPRAGSKAAAVDDLCRTRLSDIASRHHASVIDYRWFSALTMDDTNFWDPLHYRLPVARRLEKSITDILLHGRLLQDDPVARLSLPPAR